MKSTKQLINKISVAYYNQLLINKITIQQLITNPPILSQIQTMSIPRTKQHKKRNSTIKQQQQMHSNNHRNISQTSSIEINQQQDVHYYDLDYSDEHSQDEIVSSSDDDGRQISHEEFMKMITTNKQRQQKFQSAKDQQDEENNSRYRHYQSNVRSQGFKQMYNRRVTPSSTKDQSSYFYEYGQRFHKHENQKIDPEKQSKSKRRQLQKHSFNQIKQFKVDSYLNLPSHQENRVKSKKIKGFLQKKPINQQDSSFSLITLPQYEQQSGQSLHSRDQRQKQNKRINMNKLQKQKQKRIFVNKNKRILQKMDQQKQKINSFDNLTWRYQQAKLKFFDNFMPEQLKIGNNPYNMLKYMNKKAQFNSKILSIF